MGGLLLGLGVGGMSHKPRKECGQPEGAGRSKGTDFPLEASGKKIRLCSLVIARPVGSLMSSGVFADLSHRVDKSRTRQ